jgi:hypothetical protein
MLPLYVDDIIFGISALSVGTVLALTHGGSEPLMKHATEAQSQLSAIVTDSTIPKDATAPVIPTAASPTAAESSVPAAVRSGDRLEPEQQDREYEAEKSDD